jgi:hypothetical protein
MTGAVVLSGAVLFFWRYVSKRTALVIAGLMVAGPVMFAFKTDPRPCDGRAWFCDLIPAPQAVAVAVPETPPPCAEAPRTDHVFAEPHVNAELARLVESGVCKREAIDRLVAGWDAELAPPEPPSLWQSVRDLWQ